MDITEFKGDYAFLSNFFPSPITYVDKYGYNWIFPTVEHGYQALKSLDHDQRLYVVSSLTPGEAKKRGQLVDIRSDWEQIKISVMKTLLLRKFYYHYPLLTQLLQTGDAQLIEGNYWGDTFWGVCNGIGDNHLGKLLMELRSQLALFSTASKE